MLNWIPIWEGDDPEEAMNFSESLQDEAYNDYINEEASYLNT